MEQKAHYGAKEYFGDRPCIDPVVMQAIQLKLRSVEKTAAKHDKLINKIKTILDKYTK